MRGLDRNRLTIAGKVLARVIALGCGLFFAPRPAAAQTCGFPAGGTLTGVVNTYYPGINVNVARTQVRVDTANRFPAGNPPIAAGDMLLIIQMQDAQIDASNTDSYGDGVAGGAATGWTNLRNSGRYEYAIATSAPNAAGVIDVAGAHPSGDGSLIRSYANFAGPSATAGSRRFQVVRVPQYGSATLSSGLTASIWNGRAGGILALDVSGTLALGGATVSVDGLGFRGGIGRARGGTGGLANTDRVTSVAQNPNGMKGEGIVGRPDLAGTGTDTYPGGDMARGAPGTAGGGGTDGNPAAANDRNTGGGGGANWGNGGQGGHGWLQNDCPPSTGSQTGGYGGTGLQDATRLTLGSGAGAGTRNNPGPSDAGYGGGMILIRTGAVSGTGTLLARGTRPLSSANDGAGGGGAGGAIVVIATTGTLTGLTADASGGQGGYANLASPPAPDAPPATSGSHHGPGGGGGGGVVRLSSAATATSVVGGASGLTNTCSGDSTTQAYGATGGGNGNVATSWTLANLEGVRLCSLATRATVIGLSADGSGRIEFATGSQRRTRGFNVYGSDDPIGPGGAPLNAELVAATTPDSSEPALYRTDVAEVPRYLWIEEVETTGQSRFLGPFDRDDEGRARAFEEVRLRLEEAGIRAAERRERRAARLLARARAVGSSSTGGSASNVPKLRVRQGATASTVVDALKIEVEEAGVVRLPVSDLERQGMPAGALHSRRITLTHFGRSVPFRVESGEITFSVEPRPTDYTEGGVYVLAWGIAPPRPPAKLTRSELERRPGFVRVEENVFYAPYLPRNTDPWIWGLASSGWSGGPWSFDLPGLVVGPAAVPVRLRVVGGMNQHHRVQALVNGALAGSVEWDGIAPVVLEGILPAGALRETGNTVDLVYEGSGGEAEGFGIVYLDALDLGVTVAPASRLVTPIRITAYDSRLPALSGDYLIVAPASFRAAALRLAAAKQAEGLRTVVVDLERAYDRYSAGHVEAEAVRALLADAYRRRVRYALLIGDDTLDPRGHLGEPPLDFVPSLLGFDGEFGRVASENLYADTNGDGRPELAIGRLPARTSEEAELLVAKVERQAELLAAGEGRQLFAVDRSGALDSPFRSVAEAMASRHYAGQPVAFADVAEDAAAARTGVLAALRGGATMVHFFGHGAPQAWSTSTLLNAGDAAQLEGALGGAVVMSWACEVQWFQYHLGPSVNEALLLARDGGAVAAFGPAGITDPGLQRVLAEAVYSGLVRGLPLGEAIRRGKAEALKKDPRTAPVVAGWNLLGDPALRLPGAPRR